ncbi:MAG: chorismate synthase [Anaerolineales bacterium]|nr:chorismate synthase [Anaerolineales bacterium]
MIRLMTAGESHGPALTAILEGIPAGLPLQPEDLQPDLIRRRNGWLGGPPYRGASPRMTIERDSAQILAGVMGGKTTGAPIAILIENADHAKWKGRPVDAMTVPRPGHADLTAALKYGYDDLRPGLERASARETAARMAACSVCRRMLASLGISVGSCVVQIGAVTAGLAADPPEERLKRAEENPLRCPDPAVLEKMQAEIDRAMADGETVGGVFEIAALGVPPGLGSCAAWEQRLSARLGAALFGIPAVKGVEIGGGFALAGMAGTQAQDAIRIAGGALVRISNHAGGVEGGITNGQPVVVRAAMKPIATTLSPQPSVDLAAGRNAETRYERSDFCTVPRAAVVGEGMVCLVLAGAVLEKCGGDSMAELQARFGGLARGAAGDIRLDPKPKIFW